MRARAHEQLSSTCAGVHSFSVVISNRELLVQYRREEGVVKRTSLARCHFKIFPLLLYCSAEYAVPCRAVEVTGELQAYSTPVMSSLPEYAEI